jgi:hypothetical protein
LQHPARFEGPGANEPAAQVKGDTETLIASVNQPTNQSTNQPTGKPTNRQTRQPTNDQTSQQQNNKQAHELTKLINQATCSQLDRVTKRNTPNRCQVQM